MSDINEVAPAAGWYPDPIGGEFQRWWDGAAWTDRMADAIPDAPVEPAAFESVDDPFVGEPAPAATVYELDDAAAGSFVAREPAFFTPTAPEAESFDPAPTTPTWSIDSPAVDSPIPVDFPTSADAPAEPVFAWNLNSSAELISEPVADAAPSWSISEPTEEPATSWSINDPTEPGDEPAPTWSFSEPLHAPDTEDTDVSPVSAAPSFAATEPVAPPEPPAFDFSSSPAPSPTERQFPGFDAPAAPPEYSSQAPHAFSAPDVDPLPVREADPIAAPPAAPPAQEFTSPVTAPTAEHVVAPEIELSVEEAPSAVEPAPPVSEEAPPVTETSGPPTPMTRRELRAQVGPLTTRSGDHHR